MNSVTDALKSLILLYRISDSNKHIIEAVLTSSVYFGALFGCSLSLVAIRFSYRRVIILLDCLMIGGSLLEISENIYIFLAGRLIAGLGAGLNSVMIPLYIKSIAPKQIYGSMGAIMQAS